MRRTIVTTILAGLAAATAALAGAAYDVRVHTQKDDRNRVAYMLTNSGSQRVKVKVSYEKDCSSTTNRAKPTERQYWLQPGQSERLRRVMANSDCRHSYRVISAEYY